MKPTPCPIYTVGDGTRTQLAMRADGQWFKRVKGVGFTAGVWLAWEKCPRDTYQFNRYIAKGAGNARLPDE